MVVTSTNITGSSLVCVSETCTYTESKENKDRYGFVFVCTGVVLCGVCVIVLFVLCIFVLLFVLSDYYISLYPVFCELSVTPFLDFGGNERQW